MNKFVLAIEAVVIIGLLFFMGFCYQAAEDYDKANHNFEYGSRVYDYCNKESENFKLKIDYKVDGAGEFHYKQGDLNATIKDCAKEIIDEFPSTIKDVYVSNLMKDENQYKEKYHKYKNKGFENDYSKRKALGVTDGVSLLSSYEYTYIYKTNEGVIVQVVPFYNIYEDALENKVNNEVLVNQDTYLRPNYDGIRSDVEPISEATLYKIELVKKVKESETLMVKIGKKIRSFVEFWHEAPIRDFEENIVRED